MKIILLKDIAKVGKRYEIKEIADGHALNLLIPKGLAVPATKEALKRYDTERAKAESERKLHEELFVKSLKDLENITLTITGKANEKGHLFAGLHKEAIAEELLKQTRLDINPSFIMLDHPLKEIGEHKVEVRGAGKSATFRVVLEAKK